MQMSFINTVGTKFSLFVDSQSNKSEMQKIIASTEIDAISEGLGAITYESVPKVDSQTIEVDTMNPNDVENILNDQNYDEILNMKNKIKDKMKLMLEKKAPTQV